MTDATPATGRNDSDRSRTVEHAAAVAPDLGRGGRATRMVAVLVVAALLIIGTVHGSDDDFPLGPFHMYSTRGDPNGVARELRVQIITDSGRVVDVTNAPGAPRRAELEGRVDILRTDPTELRRIASPYVAQVGPTAVELRLVWENHPLRDGRQAPAYNTVICSVPVGVAS